MNKTLEKHMFTQLSAPFWSALLAVVVTAAVAFGFVYSAKTARETALRELADGASETGAFSVKGRHFVRCERVDRHHRMQERNRKLEKPSSQPREGARDSHSWHWRYFAAVPGVLVF